MSQIPLNFDDTIGTQASIISGTGKVIEAKCMEKMFGAKVLFKMSIVSEVLVRPTALLAYMAFEVGFMQMLKELVVTVEPCPAKMAFRVPFEALARFPLLHVPIELLLCKPLMLRHKLSLLRSIHAHFAQL